MLYNKTEREAYYFPVGVISKAAASSAAGI
jgi:hypothetical protein